MQVKIHFFAILKYSATETLPPFYMIDKESKIAHELDSPEDLYPVTIQYNALHCDAIYFRTAC